jgi:Kef-type K+ transport system membrane component KefB
MLHAAMRLSTINSEGNLILARTADSNAHAAASQRALDLRGGLQNERAASVGTVMLVLLFILAAAMAAACSAVLSSDLMGIFLAGMALSGSDATKAAWKKHVHGFVAWGAALFFACTVGFAVPQVTALLTGGALLRGMCLFVVAVLGKLALGLWAYPLNCVNSSLLGWAMNGRGEFSFLIAQQAVKSGLLGDDLAGGVVWAVVLSTMVAPIAFTVVAKRAGLYKRD